MVEEELKEIEIIIQLKKGDYFTRDEFLKEMGIYDLFDDNDKYARSRFFLEIIEVLKRIDAVKVASPQHKGKGKHKGRGRYLTVYKATKDITMRWVIRG